MTYPPRRTELKINEGRMQRRADDQMRAGETRNKSLALIATHHNPGTHDDDALRHNG